MIRDVSSQKGAQELAFINPHADLQRSGKALVDILDRFNGGIICLQKPLGLDIKLPSGICKDDRMIITVKQAYMKLLFQTADLPAHGGLGNMLFIGSPGEVQTFRQADKAFHIF